MFDTRNTEMVRFAATEPKTENPVDDPTNGSALPMQLDRGLEIAKMWKILRTESARVWWRLVGLS